MGLIALADFGQLRGFFVRVREFLRVQEISRGAIPAARSPGLLSRRVSTSLSKPSRMVDCLSRTSRL
jgi:hypothetical protein